MLRADAQHINLASQSKAQLPSKHLLLSVPSWCNHVLCDSALGHTGLQVQCSVCHEMHATMVKPYLHPCNINKGFELRHARFCGKDFICEWCSVIHCSKCKQCVVSTRKCTEPDLWRRSNIRCNGGLEKGGNRFCLDKVMEVRDWHGLESTISMCCYRPHAAASQRTVLPYVQI